MIETSAITKVKVIERWKDYWKKYENDSKNIHHQYVYNQFKMVNTMEHLAGFNTLFRDYLIQLVLTLCENLKRRIGFTLHYFQEEKVFENDNNEALKKLR